MNTTWLVKIFEGAGLAPEEAERAAVQAGSRLAAKARPGVHKPQKRSLVAMSDDPVASVDRILGRTGPNLPFFDVETRRLSVLAFTRVLQDAGIEAVVALAYAKVVVEAYEPEEFYAPIWHELGKRGPVDLDALRDADWSPLGGASGKRSALRTAAGRTLSKPRPMPAQDPGGDDTRVSRARTSVVADPDRTLETPAAGSEATIRTQAAPRASTPAMPAQAGESRGSTAQRPGLTTTHRHSRPRASARPRKP